MNPSIYSILSTVVSFIVLMTYYMYMKPDFVLEKEDHPNGYGKKEHKKVSLRLSLVYSLLFSSAIGLLVLGISSVSKNYEKSDYTYESSSDDE